jgi:hypothetical protein
VLPTGAEAQRKGTHPDVNCCATHNSFTLPAAGSAIQTAEIDSKGLAETLIAEGKVSGGAIVTDLISEKKADKKGVITLDIVTNAAGDGDVTTTFNGSGAFKVVGAAKKVTYGKKTTFHSTGPGHVQVKIKPSGAAKKALRGTRRLTVAVRVRFRPVGGTASTKDTRIKVRGRKH